MTTIRIAGVLVAALGLSACATIETTSRATTLDTPALAPLAAEAESVLTPFAIRDVTFVIPETLVVSEANGYFPHADIVWRGDPVGDRRAQIAALFDAAADRVLPGMAEGTPAVATITLVRFHGVTERTRYSVGGVYSIHFMLSLTDPATGVDLVPPEYITADLAAPGGQAALALEQQGQTEKVRVTDWLTLVLATELPGGEYHN